GVGTAVYGRLADLMGTRRPMSLGIALTVFGSVVAALAPTFGLHLLGRAAQGAGSAAVPTVAAALLTTSAAGASRSGLVRFTAFSMSVNAVNPLLGGLLIQTWSWRPAMALPALSLAVLPLIWSWLGTDGSGARLDLLGATLTASVAAGAVLLLQSPATGWVTAVVGAVLVVLVGPATTGWTRRRPAGFLPLAVVRNGVIMRCAFTGAALPATWFALLVGIPLVLFKAGLQPWQAGLVIAPCGLVGLVSPWLSRSRLVPARPAAALVAAAGATTVSLLAAATGAALGSVSLLVLAAVGTTTAFALGQPALIRAVGDAASEDVRGAALGVATLIFMVGASIGSAVVGGLSGVIGVAGSLVVLSALPVVGILVTAPLVPRTFAPADP
ncbi:MAG TPA: MFS transporter, partial [Actinomycetales bacterium]|nr:MFS transporter [Actinomycetales bacterium]